MDKREAAAMLFCLILTALLALLDGWLLARILYGGP